MATINPKSGDVVSFQLVQSGINGDARTEVKVSGVGLNYQTAKLIETQLHVKHVALFPYFKDAVNNVDDPSVYEYICVIGRNGAPEIIGLPWILESSYKIIDGRVATLQIVNFREEFRAPLTTFLKNLGAITTMTVKDL